MHENYEEELILEDAEKALIDFESAYKTRSSSCFNCGVGCKSIISLPEGEYACIKCQSFFNIMFAIKIYDIHFSVRCFKLCENYGLDVISTAYLKGFAIDLYQKGIITQADTGGLELKWQDRETAFRMIEKIANREDIGDILAYGVVEASKKIGKGAEEHAYHVKKLEPIPYTIDPYSTLLSSVGDKPDQTRSEGFIPSEGLEYYSTEWRRKYVKDGYFSYPEELKPDFEMDEEKAMNAAKRTGIMTRAYNAMTGISRKDDTIHQRFFEKPREYYH